MSRQEMARQPAASNEIEFTKDQDTNEEMPSVTDERQQNFWRLLFNRLTLAERRQALAAAWQLSQLENWRIVVSSLLLALRHPTEVVEEYRRAQRTEQRYKEMYEAWQKAHKYIRINNQYYRFVDEEYLDNIPHSLFTAVYNQLQVPHDLRYIYNLCGFFVNKHEYSAPSHQISESERAAILREIGRRFFANPRITHVRILHDYNAMNGGTNYILDAFESVSLQDIPPEILPFIYQPSNQIIESREEYKYHRTQNNPMRKFEEAKKKAKKRRL